MYDINNLPSTTSWIKGLTATEASAQVAALKLLPAPTLEENRVILSNFIKSRSVVNQPNSVVVSCASSVTENVQRFQSYINDTSNDNLLVDFPVTTTPVSINQNEIPSTHTRSLLLPAEQPPCLSTISPFTSNTFTYTVPSPIYLTPAMTSRVGASNVQLPDDVTHRVENTSIKFFTDQLTLVMEKLHKQTLETIDATKHQQKTYNSDTTYSTRLITDLVKPVPTVTGSDTKRLLQFLIQVNDIISLQLVGDQCIIQGLLSKTEGSLRVVWSSAVLNNTTWDKLRQQILNDFFPVRTLRAIINDTVYRLQRPGETLRDFVNNIKQAAGLLTPDMSEDELVTTILQAINRSTRVHLSMEAKPTTMAQLYALATIASDVAETDTEFQKMFGGVTQNRGHQSFQGNVNYRFNNSYNQQRFRPRYNEGRQGPYRQVPFSFRGGPQYQYRQPHRVVTEKQGEGEVRQSEGNARGGRR